jgi:hypothetical protein
MKTLIGWVTDPYVDVFLIALVLVRLGMGSSRDAATVSPVSDAVFCERCNDYHEDWTEGNRVTCTLAKLLHH